MSEINENTQVVKKKKKWIIPVIIGAVVALLVVIAAIIIAIVVVAGAPKRALQKQLDLGNMYLTELDYDNAIQAFEEAIKVDPYNVDAYLGLGDAYLAQANEKEENDYEEAIALLEKGIDALQSGLDKTQDARISAKIDVLTDKKNDLEIQNSYEEGSGTIVEMAKLISEGSDVDALNLVNEDDYQILVKDMLLSNVDSKIFSTDYGTLGLYRNKNYINVETGFDDSEIYNANEAFFIYFGGYKNGVRQGEGKWLYSYMSTEYRFVTPVKIIATGQFENDLPNGEFIIDEYADLSLEYSLYGYVGDSIRRTVKKINLTNGLYDGRLQEKTGEGDYQDDWEYTDFFLYADGILTNYKVFEDYSFGEFYPYRIEDNDNPGIYMYLDENYEEELKKKNGLIGFCD